MRSCFLSEHHNTHSGQKNVSAAKKCAPLPQWCEHKVRWNPTSRSTVRQKRSPLIAGLGLTNPLLQQNCFYKSGWRWWESLTTSCFFKLINDGGHHNICRKKCKVPAGGRGGYLLHEKRKSTGMRLVSAETTETCSFFFLQPAFSPVISNTLIHYLLHRWRSIPTQEKSGPCAAVPVVFVVLLFQINIFVAVGG